jgi:hypothetical protein
MVSCSNNDDRMFHYDTPLDSHYVSKPRLVSYHNASNLEPLHIRLFVALHGIQAFLTNYIFLDLCLCAAGYKDRLKSFCTYLFTSVRPLPSPIGKGGDRDKYKR